MIKRLLNLQKLPRAQSAFLFGARGVGKTTLVEAWIKTIGPSLQMNLLHTETYRRYLVRPALFRAEIEKKLSTRTALTVFLDEVQKLPNLLDEVHSLMQKHPGKVRFLLTGSSARKLKRGGANLLAGRAWTLHLHPLTSRESVADLDRALQFGTLPAVYLSETSPEDTLRAYVDTYLREEVLQEALVRRIEGFARFLDVAAQMNGEPANFSKISRDCGISHVTAQDYFSILIDTLVAFRLDGWSHSVRRQLRQSPKYYWFDCGVLNAIRGELRTELRESGYRYGKLFETWVVQEVLRFNDYCKGDYHCYYWRTSTGLEVDLILQRGSESPIAIEIKSGTAPQEEDLRAVQSFHSENLSAKLFCFCQTPHAYQLGKIQVLPWQEGLEHLYP